MTSFQLIPSPPSDAGAPSAELPALFVLHGSVEKIRYYDEETGRCELDIKSEADKGHFYVAGLLPSVFPGQSVTLGMKTLPSPSDKTEILSPVTLRIGPPAQPRTLKKFLKSGALPGLTPHVIDLLLNHFSLQLTEILAREPERLAEVPGVGPQRRRQIQNAWSEYESRCALRDYLAAESLPLLWADPLWKKQGPAALTFLRETPYEAALLPEIDFDLLDPFALRQGFSTHDPARARAALHSALTSYYKQGHCAYPEEKILSEVQARLQLGREPVEESLEQALLREEIVLEEISQVPCLFLRPIWDLEHTVARQLLAFEKKEPPWGWFHIEKVLRWVQNLYSIQLAPLQKEAIETALSSSLTLITGGPGTGKTTLLRSLVTILQTQSAKFALCSPTGRAAQRLMESTGAPAQTLHRLLRYKGERDEFTFNRGNPLDLDLVLVDEFSMVDLSLMHHLLEALPDHCALVLVGDADQIPSVGAGNLLQSLIESRRFPTVRLTEIYRQKEQSLIRHNAQRINAGLLPEEKVPGARADFHFLPVHSPAEAVRELRRVLTQTLPSRYGITDPFQSQVLVPLNRGPLGTQQLNEKLQEALLSRGSETPRVRGFGHDFVLGDKVMVTKNDYTKEVFNGDVGFIDLIDDINEWIEVRFERRSVHFLFDELDQLTLAYAISVHKAQGSEYRAVIVLLTEDHLPLAQRHLIYTAVTRGKEQVFLIADPKALATAIQSDEQNRRWQKLTELLR